MFCGMEFQTMGPTGACRMFPWVGKLGVWGRKSPSGVQGWSTCEVWGHSSQKPMTGCENYA